MSLLLLVSAYLLGGVTFLPLLLVAFLVLHPTKKPTPQPEQLKAGEIEELSNTGLDAFKQGWITVTHEHIESRDQLSSSTQSVSESNEGKSAYASLYKLVKNSNSKANKSSNGSSTSVDSSDSIESPMAGSTGNGPKPTNKKHRYYGVLKHSNLFLYKDERLRDVKHVVVLSNHVVALWPRSLSEGSLFTTNSSIAILKKDWKRNRRLSDNIGKPSEADWSDDKKITIEDVLNPEKNLPAPPGTFFIYTDVNIDKEDWYFALIRATKSDNDSYAKLDPQIHAKTLHFETQNMVSLIQTLYSSEGQLQTKWFNALMGRLFLSLQKTDFMRNYLISRIEKKLNKLKTPGFLDKFQITKVDAGHAAPFITFPVLKEINPDGDLLVSLYMQYSGCMSIQIATKFNLNLGTRFKSREMDVLLSMTLEKLEGPMLIKIKPPPSTRMWYTFENEPIMSVKIEPVISSRQLSYNIITNTIEKKLKEAVKESLVLPHWDDFIFYMTMDELYRGGVWDKTVREQAGAEENSDSGSTQDASSTQEAQSYDTNSIAVSTNDENLSILTFDDGESNTVRSEAASLTDALPQKSQKTKFSTTIGDLSKRLRKAKSTHTLGVDETNCLSDGSMMDSSISKPPLNEDTDAASTSADVKGNTLRKFGTWYYEKSQAAEPTTTSAPAYNPPEMITNRRRSRKQSSATLSSDPQATSDGTSYDFGASVAEQNLMARSIDSNAELLASVVSAPAPVPALPEPSITNVTSTPQDMSTQSQKLDPPQSILRSETVLHRRPPPPGPAPDFPDES